MDQGFEWRTKLGLAWLGYKMSSEEKLFDEEMAIGEVQDWLRTRIRIEELRPQDVLGLGRDAQLITYHQGPVRFQHRLLQEFMTAWTIATNRGFFEREVVRFVSENGWWETLLILASIVTDTNIAKQLPIDHIRYGDLIDTTLDHHEDGRRLLLATVLLKVAGNSAEEFLSKVTDALISNLRLGVTASHKKAIIELASIAEQETIRSLAELLANTDNATRMGAIQLLAEIRTRDSAEALIKHSDSLVEKATLNQLIDALVSIGRPAIEPVIQMVAFDSQSVNQVALSVLTKLGNIAIPFLIEALESPNYLLRVSAIDILGEIGNPSALEPLIAALSRSDTRMRLHIIEALGRMQDIRAVEVIVQLLSQMSITDGAGPGACAKALGRIGELALETLISVLSNRFHRARTKAYVARALGIIGSEKAISPLLASLYEDYDDYAEWEMKSSVSAALGMLGEPAVDPLIRVLRTSGKQVVTHWIIRALGITRDKRAVEPIISALYLGRFPNAAAEALGMLRDKRAVPYLMPLLYAEDRLLQGTAASALNYIADKSAVRPLIEALRARDPLVRRYAAWILGEIGDPIATKPLTKLLKVQIMRYVKTLVTH